MDRLTSLEVYAKVVETGSFIAASRALGISRPMASKHLQSLETSLGVRLLNRSTRRISLTEAGRLFHQRCQTILSELEEALAEAGNLQIEPKGLLRINAPITFGRAHLARAIAEFQSIYPGVNVDLTLNDRLVDIVDEGFDLAVRIGNLEDSSLVARNLAPCRMVVCAAPDYIQSHGQPDHPQQLAEHNCLIYAYFSQQRRWIFDNESGEIAVAVEGDYRANFGEALVEAACAGRGIILEPSFTVNPYIADGRLVPLLEGFEPKPLGIFALYPPARALPKKVRTFIDHLAGTFGPTPYWDQAA